MKRLAGLDSIRFVSALIVVLGHYGPPPVFGNAPETALIKIVHGIQALLFNGPAAVIVFFILSGLVIHYPYYHGKKFNLREFYLQRYIRIGIPMAVVALIAFMVSRMEDIGIFWSLYAELIYYTLYPLIVFLKEKFGLKQLIGVTYVIGLVLVFTLPYEDTNAYVDLGNYFTWIVGLPCWLLGVYLAEKVPAHSNVSFQKITVLRMVIFAFSVVLRFVKFHTEITNMITLNLFAFIVCFWLLEEVKYYRSKSPVKFLENAGAWSYSLYICHVLVATFIQRMLFPEQTFTHWFLLISGILLISYIFYRIVEKPSHYLAKKAKIAPGLAMEGSSDVRKV